MSIERSIQIRIGDHKYSIASDDDYLAHIRKGFEPQMTRLFGSLISKNDAILDVGANIGCTAILFADLGKSVVAFEPVPSTFRFLERNVERSGKKNVRMQNLGLGQAQGEFELTYASNNRSGGFISDKVDVCEGHTVESIRVVRLDDLEGVEPVQFMKIDVEGFEAQVIKGGMQTILSNKPVVVLEANHWCLNAFQRTALPDFCDFLKSVFPLLYAVEGTHYLDLNDSADLYRFLHCNIVQNKFQNVVGAFEAKQVSRFLQGWERGVPPPRSRRRKWLARLRLRA